MVLELSEETFESEVKKSDLPVLVDFWANWCGPCKMLAPVFEQLSGEYEGKLKFTKFDVDKATTTPQDLGVMSIPTLVVFNKGEEVDRLVGALPKAQLKQKIDEILSKI